MGRLASIHVGLYGSDFVLMSCAWVQDSCAGQSFFPWFMPGEGRTSIYKPPRGGKVRRGIGPPGRMQSPPSTEDPSTLFARINNFSHCQATALVAQGTPSDAGASRCVFLLDTRSDHGVPEAANILWSPEACLGEGSVSGDPAKVASLESLIHPARLSLPPPKPRRSPPRLFRPTYLLAADFPAERGRCRTRSTSRRTRGPRLANIQEMMQRLSPAARVQSRPMVEVPPTPYGGSPAHPDSGSPVLRFARFPRVFHRRHGALQLQEDYGGAVCQGRGDRGRSRLSLFP